MIGYIYNGSLFYLREGLDLIINLVIVWVVFCVAGLTPSRMAFILAFIIKI